MFGIARSQDQQVCPLVEGNVPHGGGKIAAQLGRSVFINDRLIAVSGDACGCEQHGGNEITSGSGSVFVSDRPIARITSTTSHGGAVTTGSGDVFVGD